MRAGRGAQRHAAGLRGGRNGGNHRAGGANISAHPLHCVATGSGSYERRSAAACLAYTRSSAGACHATSSHSAPPLVAHVSSAAFAARPRPVSAQAMRKLLSCGAVPDTWAPNGSSALMLAAAANGAEALAVLLEAGATVELQVQECKVGTMKCGVLGSVDSLLGVGATVELQVHLGDTLMCLG